MDFQLPIDVWVENLIDFILDHFQPALDAMAAVVNGIGAGIEAALLALPMLVLVALLAALAFWRVSGRFALFTLAALLLIVSMDLWAETVATLGLVITSTVLCLVIGIPLGVWMARSRVVEQVTKTTLDFMQTM